jgi:signal transduction histidine kinase
MQFDEIRPGGKKEGSLAAADALASVMAHALKQPLSAALNYVAVARRIAANDAPIDRATLELAISGVETAILRCNEIICDAREAAAGAADRLGIDPD